MRRTERTIRLAAILLICVVSAFGLNGCTARLSTRHPIQLQSGESVMIMRQHEDSFTNVSGVKKHMFEVEYISAYGMDDISSLRKEADEIFLYYEPQIDKGDYTDVSLAPEARAAGSTEARPILFQRNANGQWMMMP
jgi:hypothetical protein